MATCVSVCFSYKVSPQGMGWSVAKNSIWCTISCDGMRAFSVGMPERFWNSASCYCSFIFSFRVKSRKTNYWSILQTTSITLIHQDLCSTLLDWTHIPRYFPKGCILNPVHISLRLMCFPKLKDLSILKAKPSKPSL